jgi:hypothetical protein
MAYYDYFGSSEISSISYIGRKIVDFQDEHFIKLIKKHAGTNAKIRLLEIGPGKGLFARACSANNILYSGIEPNEKLAKKLLEQGYEIFKGMVPPIPKHDKKYDVIFLNQVFEHMRDRDEAILLIESCKVYLENKGLLFISSPDILSVKEDFYQDYTHNFEVSLERLKQIFYDHGLHVIHTDYYTFFIRGYFLTRLIALASRVFFSLGILHLLFGKKAYKVKISLFPSCMIIGQKN